MLHANVLKQLPIVSSVWNASTRSPESVLIGGDYGAGISHRLTRARILMTCILARTGGTDAAMLAVNKAVGNIALAHTVRAIDLQPIVSTEVNHGVAHLDCGITVETVNSSQVA